jgi:hypothetical protein
MVTSGRLRLSCPLSELEQPARLQGACTLRFTSCPAQKQQPSPVSSAYMHPQCGLSSSVKAHVHNR